MVRALNGLAGDISANSGIITTANEYNNTIRSFNSSVMDIGGVGELLPQRNA